MPSTQLTKADLALLWIALSESGGKRAPAISYAKSIAERHPHLLFGRSYSKADYTRMVKEFLRG